MIPDNSCPRMERILTSFVFFPRYILISVPHMRQATTLTSKSPSRTAGMGTSLTSIRFGPSNSSAFMRSPRARLSSLEALVDIESLLDAPAIMHDCLYSVYNRWRIWVFENESSVGHPKNSNFHRFSGHLEVGFQAFSRRAAGKHHFCRTCLHRLGKRRRRSVPIGLYDIDPELRGHPDGIGHGVRIFGVFDFGAARIDVANQRHAVRSRVLADFSQMSHLFFLFRTADNNSYRDCVRSEPYSFFHVCRGHV